MAVAEWAPATTPDEMGITESARYMSARQATSLRSYIVSGRNTVEGWFARVDAEIFFTVNCYQVDRQLSGSAVEIGLHHGKSFIALCLGLQKHEKAYGIDIFDNQDLNVDSSGKGNRAILESNLSRFQIDVSQVILDCRSSQQVKSADILHTAGKGRLFSIDGGHWLEITQNDLSLAEDSLAEHGVIALDDFHRPDWPDVSAGYMTWYATRRKPIIPFAIGFNKLYLCREEWSDAYKQLLYGNPFLSFLLGKKVIFQGHEVPVYHKYMLPELDYGARLRQYLKLFYPDLSYKVWQFKKRACR